MAHNGHGEEHGGHGGLHEHIEKAVRQLQKAKKIVDTTAKSHADVYSAAVDELLKDKEGLVDYEMLEDEAVKDKFAEKLTQNYIKRAKEYLGVSKDPKDQIETDTLLKAYAGVTGSELKRLVKEHGKEYTHNQHMKQMANILEKNIHPTLINAATSHLKDEHIEGIVHHTESDKFIDSDKIRLEEAIGILAEKVYQGRVDTKAHEKAIYYKKSHGHKRHGDYGGHASHASH